MLKGYRFTVCSFNNLKYSTLEDADLRGAKLDGAYMHNKKPDDFQ